MKLKEIFDKFNSPIRLDMNLMEKEFNGDYKLHSFENNIHIFKDETGDHILRIKDDPHLTVDYLWSDGDGHMHRMGYNSEGIVTLMS